MIGKALWKPLLAAGLLAIVQASANGVAAAPEKSQPPAPEFLTLKIQDSNLGALRDKDPKRLVLRAFDPHPTAWEEGLKRETLSVTYANPTQASVTYETFGGLGDSLSSLRYVSTLAREGELWRLRQVNKQWICLPGRGHQTWSAQLCS